MVGCAPLIKLPSPAAGGLAFASCVCGFGRIAPGLVVAGGSACGFGRAAEAVWVALGAAGFAFDDALG